MCVGVGHVTSSVEKSNAFNPIDCFHFPCESLTKFHYSRCEASRNIVEVLEVTSWNDKAMASPYGPVAKKRYDMGVLPHDHRVRVSGGYFAKWTSSHVVLDFAVSSRWRLGGSDSSCLSLSVKRLIVMYIDMEV